MVKRIVWCVVVLLACGMAQGEPEAEKVPDLSGMSPEGLKTLCENLYRRLNDTNKKLVAEVDRADAEARKVGVLGAQIDELKKQIDVLKLSLPKKAEGEGDAMAAYIKEAKLSGRTGNDGLRRAYFGEGYAVDVGKIGWFDALEVRQVAGDSEALVAHGKDLYWLRGISMKAVADGERIGLPSPVKVTGTKRYTTAIGGTKQVYVLDVFDLTPYLDQLTVLKR